MSWDNSNFAEGDSGVPMLNIAAWNETVNEKAKATPTGNVSIGTLELFGKLIGLGMGIAENRKYCASDRVAALELARHAAMNYCELSART